jgi:hypothetical protein
VLAVPFHKEAATVKHFPALHDFQLLRFGEDYYLINQRRDGTYEMLDKLVFHGGPGETLEMRFFSESDLLAYLARAGFERIVVHRENDPLDPQTATIAVALPITSPACCPGHWPI